MPHGELREHRQLRQLDQLWCESFRGLNGDGQQMLEAVKESERFRHRRHDQIKQ